MTTCCICHNKLSPSWFIMKGLRRRTYSRKSLWLGTKPVKFALTDRFSIDFIKLIRLWGSLSCTPASCWHLSLDGLRVGASVCELSIELIAFGSFETFFLRKDIKSSAKQRAQNSLRLMNPVCWSLFLSLRFSLGLMHAGCKIFFSCCLLIIIITGVEGSYAVQRQHGAFCFGFDSFLLRPRDGGRKKNSLCICFRFQSWHRNSFCEW